MCAIDLVERAAEGEIDAGQRLALLEKRGALLPATGDVEGALSDYRRALGLAEVIKDRDAE